jgi:diguanylate cyclase (GGDEF)-like protein
LTLQTKILLWLLPLLAIPLLLLGWIGYDFLAGGHTSAGLIASVTFGGIALFVLLAPIVIKQVFLKSMQPLVDAARELTMGQDKSMPMEVNMRDELGNLAHTLRDMKRHLRKSSKQVHFFAYHDSLTKLPNRLMFSEFLEHALAHAKRRKQSFALLFLDLDDFKRINDTLGHQAGDSVLRELSERLITCLRAEDYVGRPNPQDEGDTIARLGGDEFTILLPNITGPYQAATVAERVLAALATPFVHGTHELHVGASIGITIYPSDGADAETLIKNADMAMYHAKTHGKNTYQYFKESMNVAAMRQLTLENALRKAIEKQEFFLLYQPQLDLRTGKIVAVEALLRWRRPQRGVTRPDKFMLVAEQSGLIIPIGRWVIENACMQNMAWHEAGFKDLTVSVNISGVQFNRQDVKALVADTLEKTGLPPQFLEIELTETTIIRSEHTVTESLNAIKKLGVKVAMDDFGTGYSSLNYLRRLPIDKLKVDRSFTQGIGKDAQGETILSSILSMANGLSLPVIAEGIESQSQIPFLHKQGCAYIQGYLISEPVDAEGIANLISREFDLAS